MGNTGVMGGNDAGRRRPANGVDDTHSPVSRTATPGMYPQHPLYHTMEEGQFQAPMQFPVVGTADGRAPSPLNGEARLDIPQTQEALIATNASLKTRVSELEVIQELYRG